MRTTREERAVSTVLTSILMLVLLVFAAVGLSLGRAAAEQHRVDGAADLVALSSAQALQERGDPCRTARAVAAANDVVLHDCRRDGPDVVVGVQTRARLVFGVTVDLRGEARAGP